MNLKVKMTTFDMFIVYIEMDEDATLQELILRMVYEHELDHTYINLFDETTKLTELFDENHKFTVTREDLTLTVSRKEEDRKVPQEYLQLDYQALTPAINAYVNHLSATDINDGILFYVQLENQTFLLRKNKTHIEIYDFHSSYGALYHRENPEPLCRLVLRSKNDLSKSEYIFMKTVAFPVESQKNPIPETSPLSQYTLDQAVMVIQKVNDILSHFNQYSKPVNRSDAYIPTYILATDKVTIGFLEEQQLLNILGK